MNGDVEQAYMRDVIGVKRQEVDSNLFREGSLLTLSALINQSLSRLGSMTSNAFLRSFKVIT